MQLDQLVRLLEPGRLKPPAIIDTVATGTMIVAACVMTAVSIAVYLRLPPSGQGVGSNAPGTPRPVAVKAIGRSLPLAEMVLDGSESAAVGLVLFTDLECPYCKVFAAKTLPEVRNQYVSTRRAFVGLMHFPLTMIHPEALKLAVAVECSGREGKAWDLHDQIVAAPKADLRIALGLIGVQPGPLEECVAGVGIGVVNRQLALGNEIGITGTPTVLYGVREGMTLRVTSATSGAVPFAVVSKHLDDALAASQDRPND